MHHEERLEEELRLFYVALTRAKTWLYVLVPLHSVMPAAGQFGAGFNMAQLTRFIPMGIKKSFDTVAAGEAEQLLDAGPVMAAQPA